MAKPNKDKQNTEDVLEMLDNLEKETIVPKRKTAASKKTASPATAGSATGPKDKDDEDIMGFLDSLTQKSRSNSGRSTPAPKPSRSSADVPSSEAASEAAATVPSSETVNHGEPEETTADIPDPLSSITNWWSRNKAGIWDSATSAVKQAEQKVRELQPEVQHSSKAFESLVTDRFSKLGLNKGLLQTTLSSVLETIAPPISLHEQLKIHVFHDMVGYPSIDDIVYSVFDRVMQQVEGGGDLTMIVQKGKERHRRGSDSNQQRELGIFKGSLEAGRKLAFANIEESAKQAAKDASADEEEIGKDGDSHKNGPMYRISNIFLSIQPASIMDTDNSGSEVPISGDIAPTDSSSFFFIIYLYDPHNDIKFSSVSQAFPYQWAQWLDGEEAIFENFDADPREWVTDWIEEGLGLAVGTVAQSYVAKRMGVDALYKVNKITSSNAAATAAAQSAE